MSRRMWRGAACCYRVAAAGRAACRRPICGRLSCCLPSSVCFPPSTLRPTANKSPHLIASTPQVISADHSTAHLIDGRSPTCWKSGHSSSGTAQTIAAEGFVCTHAGGAGVSALRKLANGFGDGTAKVLAAQTAQEPPVPRTDAASAASGGAVPSDTRAGLSREMDAAAANVERARGALRPVRLAHELICRICRQGNVWSVRTLRIRWVCCSHMVTGAEGNSSGGHSGHGSVAGAGGPERGDRHGRGAGARRRAAQRAQALHLPHCRRVRRGYVPLPRRPACLGQDPSGKSSSVCDEVAYHIVINGR